MVPADTLPPRLLWQCRRGMRELDLLFERFLERGYDQLSDEQRGVFGRLLDYPDQLLFEFLIGRLPPSDPAIAELVALIRERGDDGPA